MEKEKSNSAGLWEKLNNPVKPAVAWSIYGGVLAAAVILALVCWL